MLAVRDDILSSAIERALDSAAEAGEIDACTASVLRLYGCERDLERIVRSHSVSEAEMVADVVENGVRRTGAMISWRGRRESMAARFVALADELFFQIDAPLRGALLWDGLGSLRAAALSMANVLSAWALVDEVQGGCLENFRRGRHVALDRHHSPHRRAWRRLCSPSFVRRYVRRSSELGPLRGSADALRRRLAATPTACVRDDHSVWCDLEERLATWRAEHQKRLEDEDRQFWQRSILTETTAEKRRLGKRLPALLERRRRSVLRRAAATAASVIGPAAVGALARGELIELEPCDDLVLRVRPRRGLASRGHGVLDVAAHAPGGELLAELCVYQDGVPALDQVVGLALMARSGLAGQVIDEANLTLVTEAGAEHRVVGARHRRALESDQFRAWHDRRHERARDRRWTHDEELAWCRQYWAKTRALWVDATEVAAMGRSRKMIYSLTRGVAISEA